MRILDLACGPGTLSYPLAQVVAPGGEVIGVDLALGMIELARREAPPGLPMRFELMDIEDLRFPEHSFDAAVCGHGFQFVPDLRRALAEARRVLEPDARLAASVPVDPAQVSEAQAWWSMAIRLDGVSPTERVAVLERAQRAIEAELGPGPLQIAGATNVLRAIA
jgi:ubiquinone/menaquinone biosynthesis C-methylase UbiE